MSGTIAQKVDTQARVIRSLNLIHCADTQHIVGAVELERLLNLEVENLELKQRIKRMEEAGDMMALHAQLGGIPLDHIGWVNAWREAKEDKP